ncbi:hypothetical protein FY528_13455 [Hymenobacter lutimineralis]|uniref:DUF3311 domain-containing protein n=1 Tax=Hymenobacter lutimineralis TaxID=2606448 RepID=A0A5D6UY42_9BACT|nr:MULTISPECIES: hypothetical protein [Hymenobacter]QIX63257.1 hypothetical protein HER32_19595 [Hymenobacter sp. BT18]TYZ08050.1 hypothetical protein FY528_13455 [Hymenobacter lutimineralis]
MPPISPQEQPEQRRGQRLLFVGLLFAVLLNFPFLAVFDHDGRVAGIPVLYLYVLLAWSALVLATAWLVRAPKNQ